MAYRRRQGITRASTFKEEINRSPEDDSNNNDIKSSNMLKTSHTFTSSSSLAAQAIRASATHRESSLSSAYAGDSFPQRSKVFDAYEDSSARSDSKGFWGVLARKAKAILEEDNKSSQLETPERSRFQMPDTSVGGQSQQSNLTPDRKMDNPRLRKGLDKITSSLNQIGDTFEKAFEEGRTIVENKTADIIQETRKLQIRRKGSSLVEQNQASGANSSWQQPMMQPNQPQNQMNHENQLKASRDVAMATAAKAKLLLRELKTVKADLAFAKQRCSQLEEENKILRESREKGGNPADDDLIRLQLETLLAEKARLAHENSIFARENRFLREIVEYHQLTMQDVVYLDEGSEEVTEVYPIAKMLSISPPSPVSPPLPSEITASASPPATKEIFPVPNLPQEMQEASGNDASPSSVTPVVEEEDAKNIPANKEEDSKTAPALEENAKTRTKPSP
ncbi:hypothetical protein P3X46_005155 [Hevea brasiliensis]|uniref:Uncharacterized protein n=1 Tax=Hevea brasiliensis TaxID=3981 RepID=A0ABQ9N3X4_HEVBR|nr:uncharacterized protein LOC110661515 [Hevea brasiliensis]KAJ9185529.1 hypothetical protein P3X46_005155 [Hevea brasiliensis]